MNQKVIVQTEINDSQGIKVAAKTTIMQFFS